MKTEEKMKTEDVILSVFLLVILLAGLGGAMLYGYAWYADWRVERAREIEKWADSGGFDKCRMDRVFSECLKAKPGAPEECARVAITLSQARRKDISAGCL